MKRALALRVWRGLFNREGYEKNIDTRQLCVEIIDIVVREGVQRRTKRRALLKKKKRCVQIYKPDRIRYVSEKFSVDTISICHPLAEESENYVQSPGIFALYIWSCRTRCFIPLYMHIRISAGCISNLILSVGASAGSVKSFPGDSVPPSTRVSYIFPSTSPPRPLGKIYSTREKET